ARARTVVRALRGSRPRRASGDCCCTARRGRDARHRLRDGPAGHARPRRRRGLRALIEDEDGLELVAEAADGLEATRRIGAAPELDSLRVGASGFLLKDAGPDEILAAIRVVHEGQALLAPSVTRRVVSELLEARARVLTPHPRIGDLTAREREVVALVGRGL